MQRGPRITVLLISIALTGLLAGCEDGPPTKAELDAMSAVQRAHGHVGTDGNGHAIAVTFQGSQVRDSELAPLAELPFLEHLNVEYSLVTDAGLAHLEGCRGLKQLSLRGTHVTGTGLSHLQHLTSLQELDLEGLPITDDSLVLLGPIKSLRRVYVARNGPTSAGIDALRAQNPSVSVSRK